MVGLGVVERRGVGDFCGDGPEAGAVQLLLEALAAIERLGELRGVGTVDRRTILASHVVALAHALLV